MKKAFSRRSFLAGAASLAGTAQASAQSGGLGGLLQSLQRDNSAEWKDAYDSFSPAKQIRTFSPTLSPTTAQDTELALQKQAAIASQGGWPSVPDARYRVGVRDAGVATLRHRLSVSGDLDGRALNSDTFDSYVDAGVRRFQARHGMAVDGVVGKQTLKALNVSAQERLAQLETNLVRLRSMSGFLGDRFIMVNVPAAEIETVENGRVASRHTAVVGKIDRQTPILNSKIFEINFNPYWTVPKSIILKDLIPRMQKTPSYLTDHKIRIYAPDETEIPPAQVNWNSEEALNYRFRQEPGELNSLGKMRINFHNPHAVYLHDTPDKDLFGKELRFHSSGCVRVQNILEFANWLLKYDEGWSRQAIDEAIASGQRIDAKIGSAVPLYMTYVTAWATPSGTLNFRDDIYDRDGLGPLDQRS